MDQSIIVAGGGRVGRRTAAILDDYDHDVTVIEQESDRCEHLADAQLGVVINGDAGRPSILDQADPEGADAVVFPEAAGARSVVDELLGRRVRSLQAATGDFDVVELEVAPGRPSPANDSARWNSPVGVRSSRTPTGRPSSTPERHSDRTAGTSSLSNRVSPTRSGSPWSADTAVPLSRYSVLPGAVILSRFGQSDDGSAVPLWAKPLGTVRPDKRQWSCVPFPEIFALDARA